MHCTSTNHGAALRNWVPLIRGSVARTDDVQQQNNTEKRSILLLFMDFNMPAVSVNGPIF